jgi:hypothetical protein
MTYLSMDDYKLLGFRKSTKEFKKYDAILSNRKTGKIKYMSFGDNRYDNYRDLTELNLYPDKIHNDKKRRLLYRIRHHHNLRYGYYSPSWFSYYFLW